MVRRRNVGMWNVTTESAVHQKYVIQFVPTDLLADFGLADFGLDDFGLNAFGLNGFGLAAFGLADFIIIIFLSTAASTSL